MSAPTQIAGIFTINCVTNTDNINLHTEIPKQDLILKTVSVRMTTSAVSIAQGIIYADLPFLSASGLVDDVEGFSRLPLVLSSDANTVYCPNIPLSLCKDVPSKFTMKVFGADGALVTGLVSVTLQFAYSRGFFR